MMTRNADGHWLAGLVDGEGSFTLYAKRVAGRMQGYAAALVQQRVYPTTV